MGIDVDGRKVAAMNAGESYFGDVSTADVAAASDLDGRPRGMELLAALRAMLIKRTLS